MEWPNSWVTTPEIAAALRVSSQEPPTMTQPSTMVVPSAARYSGEAMPSTPYPAPPVNSLITEPSAS